MIEMMPDTVTDMVCPRCGCREPKTLVHGHYQCDNCKCVADGDCCQGEMAAESWPTDQGDF